MHCASNFTSIFKGENIDNITALVPGLSDVQVGVGQGMLCLACTKKPELYIRSGAHVFRAK
jgi:hypothetical protein